MFANIKKMLMLARIIFKGSSYSGGSSNGLKKNNNKWMYIVLPLCFLPLLINMVAMLIMGYQALSPIGDEYLIIKTYLTLSALITLLLGFFYAISVLFFSNDHEILSHLPLHPWQICGARFLVILIYEYLFEAFIYIPFVIAYGIMAKAGILFFIYALIAGVLLPVLPVALLSVVAMLLMRFIPFFKSKDRVNLFTTALSIVLIFVLYLPFINAMSSAEEESMTPMFYMIAGGPDSIAGILEYVLPSLGFSFGALSEYSSIYGFINIILAVVVSVASFIFFMAVANLIYDKAASGITDSKAKHKTLSATELTHKSQKTSALRALIVKEIRLALRSPIFFMNCILMSWIWPVLIVIILCASGDMSEALVEIQIFMENNASAVLPYILAGIAGITAFMSSTSCFTSTALSREGAQISFSKMLPVSYYTQLKAKMYASFLLCALPVPVILFIAGIIFSCGVVNSFLFAAISLLTFFYVSCIGLLVDMGRPKLIWDNEQAAVKQNFNALIAMMLTIPVAMIVIGLSLVPLIFNLGTTVSCVLHILLAVAASAIFMLLIKKNAEKCYNNIQI